MKTMKKLVCGALSLASICAFGLGLALTASAEATTTIEATAFEMKYGASVRAADPAGIRFTALVGKDVYAEVTEDENKSFGMFIVPDSYMDDYETYIETYPAYEGKYYEYFSEQKKMIDFTYETNQLISQYGGYLMKGAITDVLFENLTRKFVGVAYVKTTTENSVSYEYAKFNRANNARSIAYVSSAAINANEGTLALENYLKKSAYNLLGVTYNAEKQNYTYGGNEYATLEEITEIDPSDAYSMSAEPLALNIGKSASVATKNLDSVAVTYTSSDESVVTVNERGAVTALKEGTATITAKAGSYTSERVVNAVLDHYDFGADEMILAKSSGSTYKKSESPVLGRENVYAYTAPNGWNDFLAAKHTTHQAANSEDKIYETSAAVQTGLKANGYQYVAIDFALSTGARTVLFGMIPETGTNKSANGGVYVTPGYATGYYASVDTEEEQEYFAIYSNGKEVTDDDKIEANVWYTGVVKIKTSDWADIGFTIASVDGKPVYVSGVRYYTNDSFKTDYQYSYVEYGADEMVLAVKTTATYEKSESPVFGRENVYAYTAPMGWDDLLAAKQTTHRAVNASEQIYDTTAAVLAGVKAHGYQYVAIDFALSEGATTTLLSMIPTTGSSTSANGGIEFTAGSALAYRPAVDTDEEKAYSKLYLEGREVSVGGGETAKVGVWYTAVVKIKTSGWANIGFSVTGNSKPIYVSGVRYYVDNSFETEYTTLADYYEYGADEFVDTKTAEVYVAADGEVNGKTGVYNFTGNSWSNEINAINTTHVGNNAIYADPTAVRANLNAKGYKYIAMDFCLSEGASIRVLGSSIYGTLGMTFTDGAAIAYAGSVAADNQASYFHIYANGKEVKVGDTAAADVWYTVVIELLIDPTGSSDGDATYSTVGFGVGNNKAVYIAGGRYYTNDTYKTDYASGSSDLTGEETSSPKEPEEIAYTEYFFDSAAGRDGNDGLSASAPKASLAAAVKIASTASETQPVKLLFKKGSVFEGKATFVGYQSTNAFPLILDSYGEGEGYPKFVGTGSETTKNKIDAVLYFKDDNVWVKNLEVTGPTAYQGIAFQPSSGGAFENILVEGNYVHDINFNWTYSTQPSATSPDNIDVESVCPKGDGTGRYVYRKYSAICLDNDYTSAPAWFENVWIRNNRVENVGKIGINVYNRWNNKGGVNYGYNKYVDGTETYNDESKGLGNYPHKNVYVTGNYLSCCGGDGLVVSGATGGKVNKNVSYYANYLGRAGYYNAGIWVFACTGTVVEYNEAAYTYMRNGGQDAEGFDIDNACRNIIFRYNYAHHNEGGGLLLCNNTTTIKKYDQNGNLTDSNVSVQGDWGDNYIYGNVFAYNGKASDSARSAFITVARAANDAYIYNNTVVMSGEIKEQNIVKVEAAGCTNHYYYNNLFYSETANGAKFNLSSTMAYRFDGNLFYNVTTSGISSQYNLDAVSYDPELTGLGGLSTEDFNGFEALSFFVPENLNVSVGGSALPEKALAAKSGEDALGNKAGDTHIGALVR